MLAAVTIASLLDSLDVAVCGFDAAMRTLFWNQTFLRFFPEHHGFIHAGEGYDENLRRFYRGRRAGEPAEVIERLVAEGVARHLRQSLPFAFDHRGRRLKAATAPLPDGGSLRLWREQVDEARGELLPAPLPAFDAMSLFPEGAAVVDSDYRILICNDAFRWLYDVPLTEPIVGRSMADVMTAGGTDATDAAGLRRSIENALSYDGAPVELELPVDRWRRVVLRYGEGGRGLCLHSDVTAARRQERELRQAQADLRNARAKLDRFATQDPLTGLANRRAYADRLAAAGDEGIGLILIGVDGFEWIAERFGHIMGDDVLQALAQAIEHAVRPSGALAARIDGAAFAVVGRPDDTLLATLADRIRRTVAAIAWTTIHPQLSPLTVSLGFGASRGRTTPQLLEKAVDSALRRAIRQGGDRVEIAFDDLRWSA